MDAAEDGVLFQIVVPAGETVAVKTVVGVLAAAGETPELKEKGGAPRITSYNVCYTKLLRHVITIPW